MLFCSRALRKLRHIAPRYRAVPAASSSSCVDAAAQTVREMYGRSATLVYSQWFKNRFKAEVVGTVGKASVVIGVPKTGYDESIVQECLRCLPPKLALQDEQLIGAVSDLLNIYQTKGFSLEFRFRRGPDDASIECEVAVRNDLAVLTNFSERTFTASATTAATAVQRVRALD